MLHVSSVSRVGEALSFPHEHKLEAQEQRVMSASFFSSKWHVCVAFHDTHTNQLKKSGSGMSVPLIWLFCFLVDPIAWVCIHSQFLQALPVKPGMRVSLPTPIGSIVHSIWLSLTHTVSCLRGSHEPILPPRKEMFVTSGPVSHNYTVQAQKCRFDRKIDMWNHT